MSAPRETVTNMNIDPLPDRWHSRDLPVLFAVARRLDAGELAGHDDIAADLSIDEQAAARALVALAQADYLEIGVNTMMSGTIFATANELTERGRRTVGLWPSGEETVDALVDALRQAEQSTADPEERNLIRRAAGAVGSVSREVMIDVVGAVIARQSGMG